MNWKILLLLVTHQFVSAWLLQSDETSVDGSYCQCQCLFDCSCFLKTGRVYLTCENENGEMFSSFVDSVSISNVPEEENFIFEPDTFNFSDITELDFIHFTNSTIKSIQHDAFKNIPYLQFFNLSGNHLTEIPSNIFQMNEQLHVVDLSNNPLKIPQNGNPFLIAPSVKRFDLSNCGLNALPDTTFMYFNHTEELYLSSNHLTAIDNTTFMYLGLLQSLHLSKNEIKSIPSNTFVHNLELRDLYINENPITSFENIKIQSLFKLEIQNCQISKIDKNTFSGLENLVELNLKGNVITKVNIMAFSNLKELMYLDLSENKLSSPLNSKTFNSNQKLIILTLSNNTDIKYLPLGFGENFSELYKLDLADCGISDFGKFNFISFSRLSVLNLSGNFLTNILPGTFCKTLVILDLSRNQISDLAHLNIEYDSQIRTLILRENPLQKLNPVFFSNIRDLIILDVSYCRIKSIWGGQIPEQPFQMINFLYLQNNYIQSLSPREVDIFGRLSKLDITNNPLKCDKTFISLMKWLTEKRITESNKHEEWKVSVQNLEVAPNYIEDMPEDVLGWRKFATKICILKYSASDNKSKTQNDSYPSLHTIYKATEISQIKNVSTPLENNSMITFRPQVTTADKSKMSSRLISLVILACLAGCALLLTALVFCIQWSRKQSVRSRIGTIIRRVISYPELRENGPRYVSLSEDITALTTPMVTHRDLVVSEEFCSQVENSIVSEEEPSISTIFQPSLSVKFEK